MHYLVSFRFGLLLFLSAIHHLGITHTIRIRWTPVESKVSSEAFPTRSSKLLTPFDWLPKLIYSDNSLGLISARKSSRQMISRLTMWSGLIFLFFLFFLLLLWRKLRIFTLRTRRVWGLLGSFGNCSQSLSLCHQAKLIEPGTTVLSFSPTHFRFPQRSSWSAIRMQKCSRFVSMSLSEFFEYYDHRHITNIFSIFMQIS